MPQTRQQDQGSVVLNQSSPGALLAQQDTPQELIKGSDCPVSKKLFLPGVRRFPILPPAPSWVGGNPASSLSGAWGNLRGQSLEQRDAAGPHRARRSLGAGTALFSSEQCKCRLKKNSLELQGQTRIRVPVKFQCRAQRSPLPWQALCNHVFLMETGIKYAHTLF